jgi:NAD(P)-dependent dehydrogenase (short-subunit alcohol dehydrogenase family)
VVDQIRATGGRADAVAADLAAPDGALVLAAQVRNLIGNRLDIFVSNAGISKAAPIESITVKDFDDLFAVNVRAPYFLLQQLLTILGEGGSVVFVSSLGARAAGPVGLRLDQGRHQHAGEVFRCGTRSARHPRQRGGARRDRHRHVEPRDLLEGATSGYRLGRRALFGEPTTCGRSFARNQRPMRNGVRGIPAANGA